MDKKSHISYNQLEKVISLGLLSKIVKGIQLQRCENIKPIPGAIYNGLYIGSPGKDIFLMLPYLEEEQIKKIAVKLSKQFPMIPPSNHVNTAACIRFIYGQFEKQGTLKSNNQFKEMKKEEPNWVLPRKFLKLLYEKFEKRNNFYGLTILCEMEGHRLGDESLIYKDKNKLDIMEKTYVKSVEFAHKCKSYKQMFTPYFWAAKYFMKFGNKQKAIDYSKLTIKHTEKYCPDARGSYIQKVKDCLKYLKLELDKNKWKKFYQNLKNISRNKCVKKALKSI